ncbi:response regulator [Geomesophilobacter sediminis]|uniref:Response regulator n=1 Tax=Geomesophilobacter sediminis TaxID=2798584 RepID=A0A8J7JBY5_9BACT|nr:response regulator [Geomesophilobacter sediminis]MBJ6724163.1 response regulator [Geomesophilobacter sediminis]
MHERLNLLLVEENQTCRETMHKKLCSEFPEVNIQATCSYDEAIDLLKSKHYDLILCDSFLPKTKRIHFVNEVCEMTSFSFKNPLIIVVTGDIGVKKDSFGNIAKHICVADVLYKPIDQNDLIQKVSEVVRTIMRSRL